MTKFSKDDEFKNAHKEPKTIDFKGKGKMQTFKVRNGESANAYTLNSTKNNTGIDKYLFVIHEWWGLNDHIKQETDRLFEALDGQVTVMALDLYDGKVAKKREDAAKFMESVSEERAKAIIQAAIDDAGDMAEIATIGWCFGGGWSLKASVMAGHQGAGCVMYYGMPVQNAKDLVALESDVLGIYAKKDKWITPEVAKKFENLAKATRKNVENYFFDADHAFANPSSDSYNDKAAKEANKLAIDFLKVRLL
jgi:carboxymethylenebutenolidase